MIYSHSKIQLILKDIHSYFLNYLCKLSPIQTSKALLIGSAVHEGIDRDSSDLTKYFKENGNFQQKNSYSYEQVLSEAMVDAYLESKDDILKGIVGDAKILESFQEIKLEAPMKNSDNHFLGIVDLLLKTDKGWVVIDYKTNSRTPNYDDYIEQLYRYCFLLNRLYPEIPIYRLGIIGIRKSQIRQRSKESIDEFKVRLKVDYKEQREDYVTYHSFDFEKDDHIFSSQILEDFYENMEELVQLCEKLVSIDKFPIIYSEALTIYGPSPFFNLIYLNKEKAQNELHITDSWYDEDFDEVKKSRPILDIDWILISSKQREVVDWMIRTYRQFILAIDDNLENYDEEVLSNKYIVDIDLLRNYKKIKELEELSLEKPSLAKLLDIRNQKYYELDILFEKEDYKVGDMLTEEFMIKLREVRAVKKQIEELEKRGE